MMMPFQDDGCLYLPNDTTYTAAPQVGIPPSEDYDLVYQFPLKNTLRGNPLPPRSPYLPHTKTTPTSSVGRASTSVRTTGWSL